VTLGLDRSGSHFCGGKAWFEDVITTAQRATRWAVRERGLNVSQGLLVVIDRGKSLRAAANQVLKKRSNVSWRALEDLNPQPSDP